MSFTLKELLAKVERDDWRVASPFSAALAAANEIMFQAAADDDRKTIESVLSNWLVKNQPCVFGRMASRRGLLEFCIVTELDIHKGDKFVLELIQRSRLAWRQGGFEGRKSGFIISVVSERLATAVPDKNILDFSRALTSLYLDREIKPDEIYNDELFLDVPSKKAIFQWLVGVNYFSAQADGRWWQDHRVPGGIALSMNSVGHLVKSTILLHHTNDLSLALGIEEGIEEPVNLESLPRALELAMRTILNASEGPSGKATFLLERAATDVGCPVEIAENLQRYKCTEYSGYYDTDVTLPSVYFEREVSRSSKLLKLPLDFSYLTDSRFDNPDYVTVGTGLRIRGAAIRKHSTLVPTAIHTEDAKETRKLLLQFKRK